MAKQKEVKKGKKAQADAPKSKKSVDAPKKAKRAPDEPMTKAKTSGKVKALEIKVAGKSKAKPVKDLTVKQLNAAKYNPRQITAGRLAKLQDSIATFGDLSGVVWNQRTKTLVSGHQRMKTVNGLPTRIVQQPHTDEFGTVSVGYIEAKAKTGIIKIPFRAVDWDLTREKAANIAANAHGGTFDKDKLALVLADIEKRSAFDIELTGLDPLTLRTLKIDEDGNIGTGNKGVNGNGARTEEFEEFGEDNVKTEHVCPKCKFRW